jgi:hypothetical protein
MAFVSYGFVLVQVQVSAFGHRVAPQDCLTLDHAPPSRRPSSMRLMCTPLGAVGAAPREENDWLHCFSLFFPSADCPCHCCPLCPPPESRCPPPSVNEPRSGPFWRSLFFFSFGGRGPARATTVIQRHSFRYSAGSLGVWSL